MHLARGFRARCAGTRRAGGAARRANDEISRSAMTTARDEISRGSSINSTRSSSMVRLPSTARAWSERMISRRASSRCAMSGSRAYARSALAIEGLSATVRSFACDSGTAAFARRISSPSPSGRRNLATTRQFPVPSTSPADTNIFSSPQTRPRAWSSPRRRAAMCRADWGLSTRQAVERLKPSRVCRAQLRAVR